MEIFVVKFLLRVLVMSYVRSLFAETIPFINKSNMIPAQQQRYLSLLEAEGKATNLDFRGRLELHLTSRASYITKNVTINMPCMGTR